MHAIMVKSHAGIGAGLTGMRPAPFSLSLSLSLSCSDFSLASAACVQDQFSDSTQAKYRPSRAIWYALKNKKVSKDCLHMHP